MYGISMGLYGYAQHLCGIYTASVLALARFCGVLRRLLSSSATLLRIPLPTLRDEAHDPNMGNVVRGQRFGIWDLKISYRMLDL